MIPRTYNLKAAAVCWTALLAVLAAGGYAIHQDLTVHLDSQILAWFASIRTVDLDRIFVTVSQAGSKYLLLPLTALLALLYSINRRFHEALFLTLSFIGASFIISIVKLVIARPRPDCYPTIIDMPAGFSFPSSHAAQITAFVFAGVLLLNVPSEARWSFVIKGVGGILLVLVCLSRLYLQVHYPTDVVAGLLTGILWVIGLAVLILPEQKIFGKRGES